MPELIPIPLGFVNAYLLRGDRYILIDTGLAGREERILRFLDRRGIDGGQLSLILLTHGHRDHAGGARALRQRFGIPVACMDRDQAELRAGRTRRAHPMGLSGRLAIGLSSILEGRSGRDQGIEVDILFSGPAELSPWGVDAAVLPAPGHTPGSLAVVPGAVRAALWEGSGTEGLPWAVVGDLCMNRFTAPGRARLPFFASDPGELAESLERYSAVEILYPGHGGPLPGGCLRPLAGALAEI